MNCARGQAGAGRLAMLGEVLARDRPLRGYRRAESAVITEDRAGGCHACAAGIRRRKGDCEEKCPLGALADEGIEAGRELQSSGQAQLLEQRLFAFEREA